MQQTRESNQKEAESQIKRTNQRGEGARGNRRVREWEGGMNYWVLDKLKGVLYNMGNRANIL